MWTQLKRFKILATLESFPKTLQEKVNSSSGQLCVSSCNLQATIYVILISFKGKYFIHNSRSPFSDKPQNCIYNTDLFIAATHTWWHKQLFHYAHDFFGSSRSSMRMVCLCTMMSGTSARKTQGWGVTWQLGGNIWRCLYSHIWSSVLAVGRDFKQAIHRRPISLPFHVVSAHRLIWASSQHGSWLPQKNVLHQGGAQDLVMIQPSKLGSITCTGLYWSRHS